MAGLMPREKARRFALSFDPDDIEAMREHRDWLTSLIEQAIRQQAADFGQIMALHGKTTPERREAFGPENARARQIAEAFAGLSDDDRRALQGSVRKRPA